MNVVEVAVAYNSKVVSFAPKTEVSGLVETLVIKNCTASLPENFNPNDHCCDNLKRHRRRLDLINSLSWARHLEFLADKITHTLRFRGLLQKPSQAVDLIWAMLCMRILEQW
jgi:hypothetical protein